MIEAGFVPTGWAHPVLTIANLAGFRGSKAQSQEVKAILDRGLKSKGWGLVEMLTPKLLKDEDRPELIDDIVFQDGHFPV